MLCSCETSLRQPELEGSVVGAGGNQFAIRRHVDAHHLKNKHRPKSDAPDESPMISSKQGKSIRTLPSCPASVFSGIQPG